MIDDNEHIWYFSYTHPHILSSWQPEWISLVGVAFLLLFIKKPLLDEGFFNRRFINCLRLSFAARSACGLSFRLASFLE